MKLKIKLNTARVDADGNSHAPGEKIEVDADEAVRLVLAGAAEPVGKQAYQKALDDYNARLEVAALAEQEAEKRMRAEALRKEAEALIQEAEALEKATLPEAARAAAQSGAEEPQGEEVVEPELDAPGDE